MGKLTLDYISIKKKSGLFKKIFSFIFSLTLILSIFRVPFIEIGFSTFILLLFVPYAIYKIKKNKNFSCIFPILLFCLYTFFFSNDISFTNCLIKIVLFVHLIGAFNGTIDFKIASKSITTIACLLTILVILQTLSYYLLKHNLVYLNPIFVLEENQADVIKQYTVVGLYRPSAIFLEPSHYAQFSIIALSLSLFYKKANMKKALFIALGTILTTSGIGIVMCLIVFVFYIFFDEKFRKKRLLIILAGLISLLILYLVLSRISLFKSAIDRVTGSVDDYNAIEGRLFWWNSTIGTLTYQELFFGSRISLSEDIYMTGLMSIIYNHGIVGFAILTFMVLFVIFRKKKLFVTLIGLSYLFLMVFANLSNLISTVFWLCTICSYPRTFINKKGKYLISIIFWLSVVYSCPKIFIRKKGTRSIRGITYE